MKTNPKKFCYVQDWGTYPNDTLVCVGMSKPEIILALKRVGDARHVLPMAENFKKKFEERTSNSLGWVYLFEGKTILGLRTFDDTWQYWETLVHETAHLVHGVLGNDKGMMDEDEARAYQQEYLFRNIRRKLQNHYRKKRNPMSNAGAVTNYVAMKKKSKSTVKTKTNARPPKKKAR